MRFVGNGFLYSIDIQPYIDPTIYSTDELLRDQALFFQSSTPQALSGNSQLSNQAQQTRLSELESEVQHLRTQLTKARNVNDAMWELVAQRVLSEKNSAPDHAGTAVVNGSS